MSDDIGLEPTTSDVLAGCLRVLWLAICAGVSGAILSLLVASSGCFG